MDAAFKIKVASPCSASWADMDGTERVRFCALCKKNVFNLSEMSREEALDLVRAVEGGGEVCGRFYQRPDGTVLTRDCPIGWRKRLRNRIAFTAAMFAGFFGIVATARAAVRSRQDQGLAKVPPSADFWPLRDLVDWLEPDEPMPSPPMMVQGRMMMLPPTPAPGAQPPTPACVADAPENGG